MAKKEGNNQDKVFTYSSKERSHGPYIILSGLIDFLLLAAKIDSLIK